MDDVIHDVTMLERVARVDDVSHDVTGLVWHVRTLAVVFSEWAEGRAAESLGGACLGFWALNFWVLLIQGRSRPLYGQFCKFLSRFAQI